MNRIVRKLKRLGTLAATAAVLACGGSAQAAIFDGNWDPAFGEPFDELGWRGRARFFIPDPCLAKSGIVWNWNTCSGNGMKLLWAEVEFYALSDPEEETIETLYFDTPAAFPFVLNMRVTNNLLSGVSGVFPYFRESAESIAGEADFQLWFLDQYAALKFKNRKCTESEISSARSYRSGSHRDEEECEPDWGFSDVQRSPADGPFIWFTRVLEVPEPGSFALMLPALGLLAAFRRRRRS